MYESKNGFLDITQDLRRGQGRQFEDLGAPRRMLNASSRKEIKAPSPWKKIFQRHKDLPLDVDLRWQHHHHIVQNSFAGCSWSHLRAFFVCPTDSGSYLDRSVALWCELDVPELR